MLKATVSNCTITYHPPVVHVWRQLDVVPNPHRRNVWVIVLVEPVGNARVAHAPRAGTRFLLSTLGWDHPMRTCITRHQLNTVRLFPSRGFQVRQAGSPSQREGEEERGEEQKGQGSQHHAEAQRASLAPTFSCWRSSCDSDRHPGPQFSHPLSSCPCSPTPS